jgi:GPH family glycoside/pentoside/hexuronide:cation symporter
MTQNDESLATHLTDANGKLPLWIKTLYAIPRFTIRASYIIQSAYMTYFYESIGAKLTYIAAYVAIARSFDVVTDPLMGWLSDNTHSSFGRRKPYMIFGTIFYNLTLLALLNPPRTMEHPSVSHWFGISYTVFFSIRHIHKHSVLCIRNGNDE